MRYVSNVEEPAWHGYVYCSALLTATILQALINGASNKRALLVGMRLRSAVTASIYRKAFTFHISGRPPTTNLISIDAQKLAELAPALNYEIGRAHV